MRKAVRVVVSGRVQGVGFRAFVEREAKALQVDGWVRNRRDGTVEVVLAAEEAQIDRLIEALREGPAAAEVRDIEETPYGQPVDHGFAALPTL